MNVCIYGAGAVGGHLAAKLIAAGNNSVSVVARGPHLKAIQSHGIRLHQADRTYAGHPVQATSDSATLPQQDVVIVTLKANSLATIVDRVANLLKPDGVVVFAINGIPWWWNQGLGQSENTYLPLLDPNGHLWDRLRTKTLGCVIYSPNEIVEPGVVLAAPNDRWIFGEPDDTSSERLRDVLALFTHAGMTAIASENIRSDVWKKLIINAGLNPTAALTRLPTSELTADAPTRAHMKAMMLEALTVARATGFDIAAELDLDALVAPSKRPGSHRASMLQDVILNRPLEVEPILGQIVDFAQRHDLQVPRCETTLALLRGLNQSIVNAN